MKTFADATNAELEEIVISDIRNGDNPAGSKTALAVLKQRKDYEALTRIGRVLADEIRRFQS